MCWFPFTCIIKRVLVRLNFLSGEPPVFSHILIQAGIENFQVPKPAEPFRDEGALEHENVPRVEELPPVALELLLEGRRVRNVAGDVLVHHVLVAVADVVPDGAAPVVTDEDELSAPELFRQVGNVIGEYVD